jgi:uncharacterized membrane protein
MLSTFVSTAEQSPGSTIPAEDVTAATTLIVEMLAATAPEDPQARKAQLLSDLATGEPRLTTLVDATTILYERLLADQVDTGFAGDSSDAGGAESDAGGADSADGGGAEGEAGDGGEFSPIPDAVCEFTLDQDGMIGAHTALADLLADGKVDNAALQSIAGQVHAVIDAKRRQAITAAFAELFPTGLGAPLRTIAEGGSSATPGRYFLPLPVGVPGVIRCYPPEQPNLVLTTCVKARTTNEILTNQDVTPRTTVVCDLVTDAQRAQVDVGREETKTDLLSRLDTVQILLSEDRNGNGMQDAGEVDKDGDGVLNTVTRVTAEAPLSEGNRDLALLVSMATTIFDTMRIEKTRLPADQTFAEARKDFFTTGSFRASLEPLTPGVEDALLSPSNQAILGTDDVVRAATLGTLRGTVTDERGTPLAGVQVVVSQGGEEVVVEGNPATTAADGTFRIGNIPVGETTVTAGLDGFEGVSVTTSVVAIVTVTIILSPVPQIDADPLTLPFGDVMVGEHLDLPVTVRNTGTATLTLNALELETSGTPDFSLVQPPALPATVASGAVVTLTVRYEPSAVGPRRGAVHIISDAANASEITVAFSGTGAPQPAPRIDVKNAVLAFGEVEVGTEPSVKTVTISNTGTAILTLTDLGVSTSGTAQFSLGKAPTLPVNVMPGSAVTVEIAYLPAAAGVAMGTLRINSNAVNAPQVTVPLSGTGVVTSVSQIDVSSDALSFGDVEVRTPQDAAVSMTKSVMIRNTGTAPLTLTDLQVRVSGPPQFALGQAPLLPATVMPGAAVPVEVVYRPDRVGLTTGTLRIRSTAANASQVTVALSGKGVAAAVSRLDIDSPTVSFGDTAVGNTHTNQVTITNSGSAPLTLTEVEVVEGGRAGFALGKTPKLPVTVVPGATVSFDITYQPGGQGSVTGTLRIRSDNQNTPDVLVPLSGTGTAGALSRIDVSPSDVAFGEVEAGDTRTIQVTITNSGSAVLTVQEVDLNSNSAFRLDGSLSLPAMVVPQGKVMFDVVYQPTTQGTSTARLRIRSDDSNTPDIRISCSGTGVVAAVPRIDVRPRTLRFGEVERGKSHSERVTVRNRGNTALTLSELEIVASTDGVYTLGNVPNLPVTVVPGAEVTFDVAYQGAGEDTITGSLHIRSNDAQDVDLTVALSGTTASAAQARMEVRPSAIDFGAVEVGGTQTRSVTIANPGSVTLTLKDIQLNASGGSVFTLRGQPAQDATIASEGQISLEVVFQPRDAGTATGTLRIRSEDSEREEVIVALSGTGTVTPRARLQVSPASLAFGDMQVGSRRTSLINIANTGTADLTITELLSDISSTAGFSLQATLTLPTVIVPGGSVPVEIAYQPREAGTYTGTLHIRSDVSGVPDFTVSLSGTGVDAPQPLVDVSAPSLAFGNVEVGATRTTSITIKNTGTAALTLDRVDVTPASAQVFSVDGVSRLPVTVAPGAVFPVQVRFSPSDATTVTGTLHVGTNAVNTKELTVPLSGTGTPLALPLIEAKPVAFDFGDVEAGKSRLLELSIINAGTADLTLQRVEITPATVKAFIMQGLEDLPVTVKHGTTWSTQIKFSPSEPTTLTATLHLYSDATNTSDLTVALTGTGATIPMPLLEVDPSALAFGEVQVGKNRTLGMRLTNAGTAPLMVDQVEITPATLSAITVQGVPTLPVMVAAGASLPLQLTFAPTEATTVLGSLHLGSDAASNPDQMVALTGIGAEVPLPLIEISPLALAFSAVQVGTARTLGLSLTNAGTAPLTVETVTVMPETLSTMSVHDVPALPVTVAAGASLPLQLTFAPTEATTVLGSLHLESNASNTSELAVNLSGRGSLVAAPLIEVSPLALAFSAVQVGASRTLGLSLTNAGTAPLTVDTIAVAPTTLSTVTVHGLPDLPVTVAAGTSLPLQLSFAPTADTPMTGALHLGSNALNATDLAVNLSGQGSSVAVPLIEVSPAVLAFSAVQIGTARTLGLSLTNAGTAPLTVDTIAVAPTTLSAITVHGLTAPPVTVAPRTTLPLQLTFTPTADTLLTGTLHLESNAFNTKDMVVSFNGTGSQIPVPLIEVKPPGLAFGSVEVAGTQTLEVTLTNAGTAPLIVDTVEVTPTSVQAFTVQGVEELPITVDPGKTFSVPIRFSPSAATHATGTLHLRCNAVNTTDLTVGLSGTGSIKADASSRN